MEELELVVEILQHDQDWGRADFFRAAQSQGRLVHILSLGDARKPEQAEEVPSELVWLDLQEYSSAANVKLRELYPGFLHRFAESTGLLDITAFGGKVSLYWFMPVSEMSGMRNPLIDHLYALILLDLVMMDERYTGLTLITDEPLLEQPVRQIAERRNVQFRSMRLVPSIQRTYRSGPQLMLTWWAGLFRDVMFWFLLRLFRLGRFERSTHSESHVLGLTIYPTLWEQTASPDHFENRALGDWPDQLIRRGHVPLYLAIPSIGLRKILFNLRAWRSHTSSNRIVFVHTLITLSELLSGYRRVGWGNEVASWFRVRATSPILFDDLDVSSLVRREFLQEIWHPAIVLCSMIVHAASRAASRVEPLACAMYPFEFQPIERAFNVGVKISNSSTPVIGLQTSLIGASHLGYHFLPEQVGRSSMLQPPYAPLPDYVATYGTVPHRILKKTLGEDRVLLTGPIRYPYLRINSLDERYAAETECRHRLHLNQQAVLVLLALPSLRQEALTILKWALHVGENSPDIFFLVRFHYWVVLTDVLETSAHVRGFERYQIASAGLHDLFLASRLVITGTSSVGPEAMAAGCMPVIYRTTGRYSFGPITDIADGVFSYASENELRSTVRECIDQEQAYQTRKAQWPKLLEKLCYQLDGKASDRLYDRLRLRGVF